MKELDNLIHEEIDRIDGTMSFFKDEKQPFKEWMNKGDNMTIGEMNRLGS